MHSERSLPRITFEVSNPVALLSTEAALGSAQHASPM